MKMKRNNYLQTILMDKMDLVRALKIQMRMRKTIMIQSRNAWRLSRRNSKNKS
jgi:predicted nucleotidyltransferase